MLNDHPTLEDRLNRQSLIETKAEQIIKCTPPQTFGIHGDWGAGKTSFLRQLRYHLDGSMIADAADSEKSKPAKGKLAAAQYKNKVVTIWFDAWQYQHEAVPIIALLHEIRRQFSAWDKTKRSGKKLATVAGRSVLNAFSDITKLLKLETLPINAKAIQKEGEQWEKQHLEMRLGVDTIQQFLQEAIETLIGKQRRMVIFIDDLDRCSPAAAYRLLEELKVYLNLNNCVFVLGMNQEIIIDAIASQQTRYDNKGPEAALRLRAEAYLEKLCTSIERLSPPADSVELLLGWVDDSVFRTEMTSAVTDKDGKFWPCLPPNPRRVKALANVLKQWFPSITLSGSEDDKAKAMQSLLLLAYVYQFHGELFQRWQFNPEFFNPLNKWATKPQPEDVSTVAEYFTVLELPFIISDTQSSTTPGNQHGSSYPDPYSVRMFWIQSLLIEARLQEENVSQIIEAVTSATQPTIVEQS